MSAQGNLQSKIRATERLRDSSEELYDRLGMPQHARELEFSSFNRRIEKLKREKENLK